MHTGVTEEQYRDAFDKQGGVCAICKKPSTAIHNRSGKPTSLSADHDPDTMEFRGLLCFRHNAAIGLFDHSPSLLRAAIRYLEQRKLPKIA